ncbi:hypothetical protein N0V88_007992 [Collariella sp. IMI 366227]|nr:hypothetical protein N0V88_007992 [Collariella sp. IMI 366227]
MKPFHDPEFGTKSDGDIFESTLLDYNGEPHAGSGYSFAAGLPSLLTGSVNRKTEKSCTVSAERATTYQLTDPVSRFKEAVKEPLTREWFEKQKDNGQNDFFFLIGYHVTVNAMHLHFRLGGFLDPEFEAAIERSRGGTVRFKAPGERVSALEYRKVSFKWLSSKDLDKATLSKVGDEDEKDVVQVELEDDDEREDSSVAELN